ncbi:succinyldiaminopimelate transaminase [Hoyosella subflava]|uniref:Succinyldiaminopimelate transaminase n=1 Tax=Hoyosella subflava (strain DSM 45089 / JCM 17490 / NBRC 109087 / DQS3-9A1) TaxID=443218 RepID=F6EPY4_HOYSD|nr:succinyldiaminopimelate transaminase [Hoyosella subflava]AEF41805.1 Succinyldiaminopimelate transaminase [Hoyosella subflava DQS3-9A1]
MHRTPVARTLPDFPWDSLLEAKIRAQAHPDGIVDLSVGTPVDPVAPHIREALLSVADQPGYPTTHGTLALRTAAADALHRRYGVTGIDEAAVLPAIGTKELIAWLPRLLALGPGDTVVIPEFAYPTYEVGALLAGAEVIRSDGVFALGPQRVEMIYLNSPSNPTGRVLGVEHLRKVVEWARERGVIVVSDECYLGLGWDTDPVSLLDPRVCDGVFDGLLAVHSLSKTSNLASYRAGFVTGDSELIGDLLEVRKHAGMMVPLPIQAAAAAALSSDQHEAEQKKRYRHRRDVLRSAVEAAGFRIDHSEAGLYLWATRGEQASDTVAWLAQRGILVAPGHFYGPRGAKHVRIALTATDERIEAAAKRLAA